MQPRRVLTLLLALLACGACRAPVGAPVSVSSQPGWGRRLGPQVERMTVRAVPASARPAVPVTRFGKPGWGHRPR